MRRIHLDFAIPVLAAMGIGAVVHIGGEKVIDYMEEQSKTIVYSDTEIGAAATKSVPVVSSIAEMKEEDYFTIHIEELSSGDVSVYYEDTFYTVYELESGEKVLVDEYYINSYFDHDESDQSWFPDSYEVLPIGQIIYQPLDEALIAKLKEKDTTLTDTSFYVDMRGDFERFSREDHEQTLEYICFGVGAIVLIFVRFLMVSSGLFSPFIRPRFLKSWKKFIVYYGIIYYDENIDKIIAYRKQNDMEAAAYEFSKLTNTYMDEAREAMKHWNSIYGEDFLSVHFK